MTWKVAAVPRVSLLSALLSTVLLAALFGPQHAIADQEWEQIAPVSGEIRLTVHWVSMAELKARAREVGRRATSRPSGFSVLQLEVKTGVYICDIYVLDKPKRVRDHATATLGHELAHCLGLSHE